MNTQPRTCLTRLVLISLLSCAGPTLAVDGVTEINQARALAGGVTPGDTPGFPVILDQPGSYRLTGNLTVDHQYTTVIEVSASHVTIDLNGFSLVGLNACDKATATCTYPGGASGVNATSGINTTNTTVKNGTVRGMSENGIHLGPGGRVDNVMAYHNGISGLVVIQGVIRNSVATENGAFGIQSIGSVVVNSVAQENFDIGISGVRGSVIIDSRAAKNTGYGLVLGSSGSFEGPGAYKGCNLQDNNGGNANAQVSGGIQIGINLCGAALCP